MNEVGGVGTLYFQNPSMIGNEGGGPLLEMDGFLLCLSRKKVQPSLEEKAFWSEERSGLLSVKSLFEALESKSLLLFPNKYHLEIQGGS